MANIQYIGARYVPKFYENPDDSSNNWKSGVSYEAFTVVTYLDDSYTSKIPVPASVGNPANNTNYWVKTGNYNAAISLLQNKVSTLEQTAIDALNVVSLGADNTGTNDNSTLFNSLFSNHNYDKRTFYFPDGVYLINSTVLINNGCNIVLSNNAIVKAGSVMDCMFMYNTIPLVSTPIEIFQDNYLYSNMKLIGGIFDGNKLADTCIRARRFCNFTIDSVKVLNFNVCGIDTKTPYDVESEQTAELKLLNCYVTNFENNATQATCVKVGTDNEISNCILVDGLVGLEVKGANECNNIHIWTSSDPISNNGSAIKITGSANKFNNIYSDCYFNAFDLAAAGVCYVSNMTYFVDHEHYIDFNGYVFNQSTSDNMRICITNLYINSDVTTNFTNRYEYCQLNNFTTAISNRCLPISPILPAFTDINSFIYNNALTAIDNDLPCGIYGIKSNATYKPDTGHSGVLFYLPFANYGLKIYFDFNSNKIYTKVNGADTADWYDVGGNTTIASKT